MPGRILIIGGGFAGLRAAVALADAGRRVTLLEGRVSLGGRARSFTDPATGEVVDNGQHLFLAGYDRTLNFLKRLGTADRVIFQERLRVRFVEPGGKSSLLDCPPQAPPWHLLLGIGMLEGMPARDKLALASIWRECRNCHPRPPLSRRVNSSGDPSTETVEQWLTRMRQGERSRNLFWRPLTVATLNEEPAKAGASGLKAVLRRMTEGSWLDSRLGMASVGLSELYADPARKTIEEKGGEVLLNRTVTGLDLEGGRACAALLADGSRLEADAVVSAVPPPALVRILGNSGSLGLEMAQSFARFKSSPILSVNLWFNSPWMQEEELFSAMIGTRFQWLFNKQAILARAGRKAQYVSLIVSAAHDLMDRTNEELARLALEELGSCFPRSRGAKLVRSQVVREREATVSLTPEAEEIRPPARTAVPNLFLAGDWTATGLPATIESAVMSGETAAQALLSLDGSGEKRYTY